jgi:hypothetical protein
VHAERRHRRRNPHRAEQSTARDAVRHAERPVDELSRNPRDEADEEDLNDYLFSNIDESVLVTINNSQENFYHKKNEIVHNR